MVTTRFQEVAYPATRRLKCECGKRFTRSRTFTQTVNPFNKTADGQMKDYPTIWRELEAEAGTWQPDPTCTGCKEKVAAA